MASILRTMDHANEKRFEKYHHVLSQAKSGLRGAKSLLGLLIALLPHDAPILESKLIREIICHG